MRNKGIALAALIIIMVLLAIIVFGVTLSITEGLRFNISNINNEKALCVAQAGMMSGLVDYLADGLISPQSNINVNPPSEFYYSVGESSSFMLIDGSNVRANGRVVNTWPIKNFNFDPASSIVINSIVVEWDYAANLVNMKIGNNYILKSASLSSPATINSANCFGGSIPLSIQGNTTYSGTNVQYLSFSANIPANLTVSLTFNFSDGSFLKKLLINGGKVTNNEFSLRATGKIGSGSSALARRTLTATYDVTTNKITSWQESTKHIIP